LKSYIGLLALFEPITSGGKLPKLDNFVDDFGFDYTGFDYTGFD